MKKLVLFLLVLSCVAFGGIYYGNLHSHTSYSDGSGTPDQAYEYAKNYLDVLAITDHAYYFAQKINGKTKPYLTKLAAERHTEDGKFVALQGFEWTAGVGHINVYESLEWIDRNRESSLEGFYRWLVEHRKLAQFNHPISTFGTFDSFRYFPEADEYVNLIEVGNGNWSSGDVINPEMYGNYILALNRGWHLGATVGQDNHKPNWGSANEARTGIVADALTYDSIMDALWKRHTFGSEDRNVRVLLKSGQHLMGDVVFVDDLSPRTLTVEYQDTEKLLYLAVISQSGTVLELRPNIERLNLTLSVTPSDGYEWYFVYMKQMDGDEIVTSPIWFQIPSSVYVNSVRVSPEEIHEGEVAKIYFEIYNVTDEKKKVSLSVLLDGETLRKVPQEFSPYQVKRFVVSTGALKKGFHRVSFLVDGKIVQSVSFFVEERLRGVIMIDTLHENDHLEKLKVLAEELEKKGYRVEYPKVMLKDLSGVDILIISTPKEGGLSFAKKLSQKELEAIENFKGKIYIVPGGDEEYRKTYLEQIKGEVVTTEELKEKLLGE
ncbi:CehA/McbA family metallohydrolase [Thermotoga neapolitana]|uniref:PHP C-terminal domain protein n=1 Tax=Thermotoga neapolitana (strain ATCC 49049 / DSM 4359 / NBRC 107923 / NS-E) TaxID=309803 RepID=B9KB44_THENN|nr:CehA/McbA family metallohydrolase [Thermotoga neapolitana]ACM22240.1 PHP C-terminal domain protein precursor [Thermotoga neapolitana DSM 4359]KFZ22631.1 PHP C-terminal domain protein precursor [Thermotoga neapolitana LA10]HBF10364.1 phosphotransferase [Thermotoga neapolitana]